MLKSNVAQVYKEKKTGFGALVIFFRSHQTPPIAMINARMQPNQSTALGGRKVSQTTWHEVATEPLKACFFGGGQRPQFPRGCVSRPPARLDH